MYGLVNKAVEELVVTKFSQEQWEEIKRRADIGVEVFVGMDPYDDAITYKLVGAASEVLGLTPEQVLEAFGEFWLLYTAQEGYGELLDITGLSFAEFLGNMDNLHARVQLLFPALQPPGLRCTDVSEESVRLHYTTERDGLAPMVIGLLKGLAQRFEITVDVVHDKVRGQGSDHDEFLIKLPKEA